MNVPLKNTINSYIPTTLYITSTVGDSPPLKATPQLCNELKLVHLQYSTNVIAQSNESAETMVSLVRGITCHTKLLVLSIYPFFSLSCVQLTYVVFFWFCRMIEFPFQ